MRVGAKVETNATMGCGRGRWNVEVVNSKVLQVECLNPEEVDEML